MVADPSPRDDASIPTLVPFAIATCYRRRRLDAKGLNVRRYPASSRSELSVSRRAHSGQRRSCIL